MLRLPGIDERDLQLTKWQYVNTTAATSTSVIIIRTATLITNATTVTTITTIPRRMKAKFFWEF